ncbi:hypothetical protein D3C86_1012270 [compost metagenome]
MAEEVSGIATAKGGAAADRQFTKGRNHMVYFVHFHISLAGLSLLYFFDRFCT